MQSEYTLFFVTFVNLLLLFSFTAFLYIQKSQKYFFKCLFIHSNQYFASGTNVHTIPEDDKPVSALLRLNHKGLIPKQYNQGKNLYHVLDLYHGEFAFLGCKPSRRRCYWH